MRHFRWSLPLGTLLIILYLTTTLIALASTTTTTSTSKTFAQTTTSMSPLSSIEYIDTNHHDLHHHQLNIDDDDSLGHYLLFNNYNNYGNISTAPLISKQVCSTNSAARTKAHKTIATNFLRVMNGCHMDTSSNQILYITSKLFIDWFTPGVITSVIFVFMMILPWIMSVYDDEQKTQENMSRFAHYILLSCDLMFRISWTTALGSWLLAVFRQASPCSCVHEIFSNTDTSFLAASGTNEALVLLGRTSEQVVGYQFGMPHVQVLVTTVLALHAIQKMSIPIGVFIMGIVPCAAVFSGYASTGQVLAAFFIGIPLHFYQVYTPQWIRIIDFCVNLCAGLLVLPLTKHYYLSTDFAFAELFFEGVIMQVFCIVVMIVLFSLGFLKITIQVPIYRSSPLDIQHMRMRLTPEQKQLLEGEQMGYDHSDYAHTSSSGGTSTSSSIGGGGGLGGRKSSRRSFSSIAARRKSSGGYQYDDGHVFSVLYAYPMILYGIALGTFLLVGALRVASAKYLDELLSFGQSVVNK